MRFRIPHDKEGGSVVGCPDRWAVHVREQRNLTIEIPDTPKPGASCEPRTQVEANDGAGLQQYQPVPSVGVNGVANFKATPVSGRRTEKGWKRNGMDARWVSATQRDGGVDGSSPTSDTESAASTPSWITCGDGDGTQGCSLAEVHEQRAASPTSPATDPGNLNLNHSINQAVMGGDTLLSSSSDEWGQDHSINNWAATGDGQHDHRTHKHAGASEALPSGVIQRKAGEGFPGVSTIMGPSPSPCVDVGIQLTGPPNTGRKDNDGEQMRASDQTLPTAVGNSSNMGQTSPQPLGSPSFGTDCNMVPVEGEEDGVVNLVDLSAVPTENAPGAGQRQSSSLNEWGTYCILVAARTVSGRAGTDGQRAMRAGGDAAANQPVEKTQRQPVAVDHAVLGNEAEPIDVPAPIVQDTQKSDQAGEGEGPTSAERTGADRKNLGRHNDLDNRSAGILDLLGLAPSSPRTPSALPPLGFPDKKDGSDDQGCQMPDDGRPQNIGPSYTGSPPWRRCSHQPNALCPIHPAPSVRRWWPYIGI